MYVGTHIIPRRRGGPSHAPPFVLFEPNLVDSVGGSVRQSLLTPPPLSSPLLATPLPLDLVASRSAPRPVLRECQKIRASASTPPSRWGSTSATHR